MSIYRGLGHLWPSDPFICYPHLGFESNWSPDFYLSAYMLPYLLLAPTCLIQYTKKIVPQCLVSPSHFFLMGSGLLVWGLLMMPTSAACFPLLFIPRILKLFRVSLCPFSLQLRSLQDLAKITQLFAKSDLRVHKHTPMSSPEDSISDLPLAQQLLHYRLQRLCLIVHFSTYELIPKELQSALITS